MQKFFPYLILVAFVGSLFFVASIEANKPGNAAQYAVLGHGKNGHRPTGAEEAISQDYALTRDPRAGRVPVERLIEARKMREVIIAGKRQNPLAPVSGISWQERGPNNVGGRSRVVWFDLADAANGYKKVWAAGVSGGLWYTLDITAFNPTWVKIDDFFDNIAVSSFAQSATNPQLMYFGTGEGWFNSDAVEGLGIWKSTNGGSTWTRLTSTNNFAYVQDLQLDNANNLYASLRNRLAGQAVGIQKSTDGGNSWTQVLGAPVLGPTNRGADLELAANGDLYATIGFFSNGRIYRSNFGIYGTTTGNAGTWEDITPNPTSNAIPLDAAADSYDRIELAIAPSDPATVYALFEGNGTQTAAYIKKYDANTNTWVSRTLPNIIDQGSNSVFTRNQAWYDLIAVVDPNDPQRIWIGGVDALRSDNGGVTWSQKTTWSLFGAPAFNIDQNVHADHHAYQYVPGTSTRLVMGTDGGVDYTEVANQGSTDNFPQFARKNSGYNVTQFYTVASHPTNANYFLAGAQDNGTQRFLSAGLNSTLAATGGDGGFCHIDQNEPNIQITAFTRNNYSISTNGGASFTSRNKNNFGGFINPTDYDDYANILYAGNGSGVFLRYLSPATDGATTSVSVSGFSLGNVTHVSVSPSIPNRVYFGISNGRVVMVDNAHTGTSLVGTVIFDPGINGSISCVAIDPANEAHMLVTYSNYGVNSVWETNNAGANWTSVEGNLPDMPVRWALFDPRNATQALLATEMGVWSTNSLNGANTAWDPTNQGLANVRVSMFQYAPQTGVLAAATHGRGLFTAQVPQRTTPDINFEFAKSLAAELATGTVGCVKYTDYTVNLQLSKPASAAATATLTMMADGNAVQGVDYEVTTNGSFIEPSLVVNFSAGSAQSQPITVRVYDDGEVEDVEYLRIGYTLATSGDAVKGAGPQTIAIQLVDNDVVPDPGSQLFGTIGTNNAGFSIPFLSGATDCKTQMLYTAAELKAIGLGAGAISELGIILNSKGSAGSYENLSLKVGHTTLSTLRNLPFQTGLTPVFQAAAYNTVSGPNNFTLQTPFIWNGTSNLLIELCYDNGFTNAQGGSVVNDFTSTSNLGSFNDPATPVRAIWAAANGASCDELNSGYTVSQQSGDITRRPVLRITGSTPGIQIANTLSTGTQSVGPLADVFVYNGAGQLMARVKNLTNFDYGCTNFTIDRQGSTTKNFLNNLPANAVADKTLVIASANANANGQFQVTLYYTPAEVAGWEAATGRPFSQVQAVKTKNAISSYTPGAVPAIDLEINPAPIINNYGEGKSVTATFRTGFSGFAVGAIYPNGFTFIGDGLWSNPANWMSGLIPPNLIPGGFTVTINPSGNGEAIMDVPVTLQQGAILNVQPGKKLKLPGN